MQSIGVDANSREAMARFFLDIDNYEGKIDGLSDSVMNVAQETVSYRQTEEELIRTMIDAGVINEGADTAGMDLNKVKKLQCLSLWKNRLQGQKRTKLQQKKKPRLLRPTKSK